MKKPILYIVVPCYNEEAVLPITSRQFKKKLDELIEKGLTDPKSRLLFVNDGSHDATWEIIKGLADSSEAYMGISLSRNRGHQNAILAGLMEVKDRYYHHHRLRRTGRYRCHEPDGGGISGRE